MENIFDKPLATPNKQHKEPPVTKTGNNIKTTTHSGTKAGSKYASFKNSK